jgi:tRNA C32,U32 (ribose-2'-O)-methylase TrmJ
VLPNPDNRVTLADERDDNGGPVARVTFSFGDNDRAIVEAERKVAEQAMNAAGATRVLTSDGPTTCLAPAAWATTRRLRSLAKTAAAMTSTTCGSATAPCFRPAAPSTRA